MRRKDKEITDRREIEAIIQRSVICRLAMADESGPYLVPLCFGFKDDTLYFHSAPRGKKLDILRAHPRVCFAFDCDSEARSAARACDFGMRYRSVIGYGTAAFVEPPAAKREALDIIMAHYADGAFDYSDTEIRRIAVFKVAIDNMTGKASL